MGLNPKICTKCQGSHSLPYMKGNIIQEFNSTTKVPMITEWTCPYCGHKETETIEFADAFGAYNSGIAQGPTA